MAEGVLYGFGASQASGRVFLKGYLSRAEHNDAPIDEKVAPAKITAFGELVLSGNHDVIVYTVKSLHFIQNLPRAELILYPDANHGSMYQHREEFVYIVNKFLDADVDQAAASVAII